MEVKTPAASFGQEHFGAARLGDKRRTARLVKTADLIMQHPGGSLPQKLKGWGELMGLYRLVDRPEVTHPAVLEPHRQRTLARMGQVPTVLLIHDTTDLDYTGHPVLAGQLASIGNGSTRGYLCHNSLAITPERRVLGLPSQILHRRRDVPEGETPQEKRDHPQRESRLWLAGCQAIGPAPAGCLWVDVTDRGGDTFEFLAHEHAHRRHYVIRSCKDRNLAGDDHLGCDRIHRKLHAYARDLPVLGERSVQVRANRGRTKRQQRTARVSVSAGPVTIRVPHFTRGECHGERSLSLWVMAVREIGVPPAGEEALEWVLLSDLVSETLEQASQRIDWYECRPIVEDLHKGQKGGIDIEHLRFQEPQRIEPVIALLSVIAAMLLDLRELARGNEADTRAAGAVVPVLWVPVLSGWRYGQVREDLSVREYVMALGKLGGHLNRNGDGPPGWQTLWRGWQELQLMIQGALAIQRQRCV